VKTAAAPAAADIETRETPAAVLSYIIYNKAPPPVVFIFRYLQENGKYNCK
jgi:hypothetical protein